MPLLPHPGTTVILEWAVYKNASVRMQLHGYHCQSLLSGRRNSSLGASPPIGCCKSPNDTDKQLSITRMTNEGSVLREMFEMPQNRERT